MVTAARIGGSPHWPDRMGIRVWSNDMLRSRPLGVKMSSSVAFRFVGADTGSLQVSRDHPLADRLMQADYDMVPITADINGQEWSGFVDQFVSEGAPGEEIVSCTLLGWYAIIHAILGRPNPFSPLEVQAPAQDLRAAPLVTAVLHFVLRNAARLDLPIYVRKPEGRDLSPFVTRWSRMTPLDEVIEPALDEHGYQMRVTMLHAGQQVPGTILSAKEYKRHGNPILSAMDNMFEEWQKGRVPKDVSDPDTATTISTPGLLVEVVPKRSREFVRWSTEGGGISHIKITGNNPKAHTAVVGGKSPAWINDAIDLGIDIAMEGLVQAAGAAIGAIVGSVFPGAGTVIGGAIGGAIGGVVGGFFKDNLHDVFLAYSEYTDQELKAALGPFARPEVFISSGAGTFSYDAIDAGLTGLKEARGGRTIELTVTDGRPHQFGLDERLDDGRIRRGYQVGDINTFSDRGTTISDYVSQVEVVDDWQGISAKPTIGDLKIADPPELKSIREIKKIVTNLRASALAAN